MSCLDSLNHPLHNNFLEGVNFVHNFWNCLLPLSFEQSICAIKKKKIKALNQRRIFLFWRISGCSIVVCSLFIMWFLQLFFLDLKYVKIKIWRKIKSHGVWRGHCKQQWHFHGGLSLICLSCLSCSIEISLFSSFWVVMRIHSVILEIFLEV